MKFSQQTRTVQVCLEPLILAMTVPKQWVCPTNNCTPTIKNGVHIPAHNQTSYTGEHLGPGLVGVFTQLMTCRHCCEQRGASPQDSSAHAEMSDVNLIGLCRWGNPACSLVTTQDTSSVGSSLLLAIWPQQNLAWYLQVGVCLHDTSCCLSPQKLQTCVSTYTCMCLTPACASIPAACSTTTGSLQL